MNKLITLKKIGMPEIGFLSFLESNKEIPFEIKRIYYIYDVPKDIQRGMHAHRFLKQFLWCVHGSIEIILDDGNERKNYLLDSPEKGLFVGPGIWRDMFWKEKDSVLCVVASDLYNESDYIRDYNVFKEYNEKGVWNNEDRL